MKATHIVTTKMNVVLDESQMRALKGLTKYGVDTFLETFYTKLGKAFLQPHEHGLRELFKTVDSEICPALGRLDRARKFLADEEERGRVARVKREAQEVKAAAGSS